MSSFFRNHVMPAILQIILEPKTFVSCNILSQIIDEVMHYEFQFVTT
ncbi:hypothetical protein LOK49_LG02G01893 [Camellia lanceoleosa]|uniref:Uncharacterized protein n=1 Tax=Camellia lanceoleosa TaxID=1840588 RepID=A0ACC0IW14_9ERIC|nr:hypothetical protein LOK49_LG02G01893 [Camellia lanceoleosa]